MEGSLLIYNIGTFVSFAIYVFLGFLWIETKPRDPSNIHNDSDKEFERVFCVAGSVLCCVFWPATFVILILTSLIYFLVNDLTDKNK